MRKYFILLALLAGVTHADGPLSALDARTQLETNIYKRHEKAIQWWESQINAEIARQNARENATALIDVTSASPEVQTWLEREYQRAGYTAELQPPYYGGHHAPTSHTWWLSLSW